jgi:hypothetical protein
MKYYKYHDENSIIEPGTTYVETDEGVTIREVTFNGTEYLASNVNYPHWGMLLAEGQVDYEPFVETGEVTPITEQEFTEIWKAHLALRQEEWEAAKHTYPVGATAHGFIQIFYPQGVIVNLGGNALGIADYKACQASTRPEFMYTRHRISAVVNGYDETNQWIILGDPQVHQEEVE